MYDRNYYEYDDNRSWHCHRPRRCRCRYECGRCGCCCGWHSGDGDGNGDGGNGGGGSRIPRLKPNLTNDTAICLDTDPKQLIISGSGGVPGGYVHVLLRRNDTDFSLLYPERDSSENIVHANGNWTLTLRLDANTRNVVGLEAGQYYAAFTETNAQGNVLLEAGNNVWINIKSCEKAELKFNFSEGQTLSCSGGALTLSGYGAGANAEINVWLTRKSNGAIVRMIVGHADQNGIWSATLNSAQVGPYVGAPCIPDGDYYVFAYQTQYDGFMRESQKITVHISNCCA